MGVESFGFDNFTKALQNGGRNLPGNLDKATARLAAIGQSITVSGILDQRWITDWKELSPEYEKQKKRRGDSNLMLVSGFRGGKNPTPPPPYANSFTTTKIDDMVHAWGSNYAQARALEKGFEARKLPARPHVAPALEEVEKEHMPVEIQNAIAESFKL